MEVPGNTLCIMTATYMPEKKRGAQGAGTFCMKSWKENYKSNGS